MNESLGYKAVSFAELMNDELFLTGCQSWVNYNDLMDGNKPTCLMWQWYMILKRNLLNRARSHSHSRYALEKDSCYYEDNSALIVCIWLALISGSRFKFNTWKDQQLQNNANPCLPYTPGPSLAAIPYPFFNFRKGRYNL
ncbi:MAG: hypothetical protein M9904_11875 [Chitinophagaceae bacterium]|nr:hypothetical protein [Chitinophagaceae bacterium]